MFSRSIALAKPAVHALNPGDPLNKDLVFWFPWGAIENGGAKAFNLLGSPKLTGRDRDGWGGGSWYSKPSNFEEVGGAFGGRWQSSDDYAIRPTIYFSEMQRPAPVRAFTLAHRTNVANPAVETVVSAAIASYQYGANTFKCQLITTGGTAVYSLYPSLYGRTGRTSTMIAYDGVSVRLWNESSFIEVAATYGGDMAWGASEALQISYRLVEDVRFWSRALSRSEGQRWIDEGPAAGSYITPARRFAVMGTQVAANAINQRLPLLGVGD